jgi:hypothetical protein
MERELRDELEVPGHVVGYRPVEKDKIIADMKKQLDEWEAKGYGCLNDVPDCLEKKRFRDNAMLLGIKNAF